MAPKNATGKSARQATREPTPRQAAAQKLASKFPSSRIGGEFGGGSLTIDGKVFAFTTKNDRVAMKLPAERIDALVEAGEAVRLTMGKRTMREWVVVADSASPGTLKLVKEALTFVEPLPLQKRKKGKK